MWAFFLGGTCVGGAGAAACFCAGAGAGDLGLGGGAGGGGGEEEIEGALEVLAEDACSFASRFMRIWGNVNARLVSIMGISEDRDTYTVGIIGGIGQRLA